MSTSIARLSAALLACALLPAGACMAQQATPMSAKPAEAPAAAAAPAAAPAPPTAASRFAILDANHDGVLSQYEYDSDAVLEALDTNHDDLISADEFQVFLGDKAQGAPDAAYRISIADTDGDGKLSDAELRRGLKIRFDWLDANKDGNVDLDELKAGFGVPMLH
ncbi:hypothetical protein LYSHEL_14990 [Lysobacter helvus]|uniref:EF-hand domain-containing protein n=2 Tax=Lysobacteraceae TaxID=32033 RepID=A0ABM7Q5G4_9GAMM|nr:MULTISPECIES: hypothetical protein [Lysobacter]BCT92475.1 hypothetical protein LYSCAS_14990 [Lysobacter caseinilyticus]BCT95628.1 hypothetical protein LYSHEL_14990 [Lysobacter helvus]